MAFGLQPPFGCTYGPLRYWKSLSFTIRVPQNVPGKPVHMHGDGVGAADGGGGWVVGGLVGGGGVLVVGGGGGSVVKGGGSLIVGGRGLVVA